MRCSFTHCALLAVLIVFSVSASASAKTVQRGTVHTAENQPLWPIEKSWDDEAEREFTAWVAQLGQARGKRVCRRFRNCINSPEANSLWEEGEHWKRLFADCADLPFVMRAYFAYKTRRPFQFVSRIRGGRYSRRNRVKDLADMTDPRFDSLKTLFSHIVWWVHSGYFRTAPKYEDTDTYPVDVTRETVVPGTVFYEPRGHVLMVIEVKPDGTVHMIDGHPDNSLTYKLLNEKNAQPGRRADNGGGFRNWRRYTYNRNQAGEPAFERETNAQITARGGGFDAQAQYQKSWEVKGEQVDYYTWVRSRLKRSTDLSATAVRWWFERARS